MALQVVSLAQKMRRRLIMLWIQADSQVCSSGSIAARRLGRRSLSVGERVIFAVPAQISVRCDWTRSRRRVRHVPCDRRDTRF